MHIQTPFIAALVLICCASLLAEPEVEFPAKEPESAQGEKEEDHLPYMPTPPAPPGARPKPSLKRGIFDSIQVNTNAQGNNIPGDAANEPSIAIDPTNPNRIVIGWRQFDNIASDFRQAGNAYSHNGGFSWVNRPVLEPNTFASDPVLGCDNQGRFFYYSLQPDRGPGSWACYLYRSLDGGITWPFETYAFGGDKEWMAIDRTNGVGLGNVYFCWNQSISCCPGSFTRTVNGGSSFITPVAVPGAPRSGTMTVGVNGEVFIIGNGFIVVRSNNAQNPAATPTFAGPFNINLGGTQSFSTGPNPAGLLGQANIAVDFSPGPHHGWVYALCSVNPAGSDPLDIRFSRSTDNGATWSPSIRVNDDSMTNNAWQWFGTMSVSPTGRIDVVWNDTRNAGGNPNPLTSELYYSYSVDGGSTWSNNQALTPAWNHFVGYPVQQKIGDYYDMVSDTTGASLAYSATFYGEQDLYFLRITQDCNNNGIPDATDIANGTSQDCNHNNLPDECDRDCNDNNVPDECDVSSGTSPDCNDNLVPDECDPDCNDNNIADPCDITDGTSQDLNGNGVPDECDPDEIPPQPSPMQFAVAPANAGTDRISMSAVVANDVRSPPVEYFFDYVSGQGGHDSPWQSSTQYTDSGLAPNSFYNYRVKARDSAVPVRNETLPSATLLGATEIESPTGISFSKLTNTSVTAQAVGSFTNIGFGSTGFFFELSPPAGTGANTWVSSVDTNITGLTAGVVYSIRVKARNFQGNETGYTNTFLVVPGGCATLGDMDGNGQIDGADIAGFVRTKLGQPLPADQVECANFHAGSVDGDITAFVQILLQ